MECSKGMKGSVQQNLKRSRRQKEECGVGFSVAKKRRQKDFPGFYAGFKVFTKKRKRFSLRKREMGKEIR